MAPLLVCIPDIARLIIHRFCYGIHVHSDRLLTGSGF